MAGDQLLVVKGYRISNEFFEKGYTEGNSPCQCSTNCCKGGVWTDLNEHHLIMAKKDLIKQHMDETQSTDESRWFEAEPQDDPDFSSGKAMGTEIINDKCAFLDKFGRCSIQLAAVANGLHKWEWKPLYCVLFPVEVSNGIVGFDPMLQGEEECCSISSEFATPLFRACKEELTYLLGEDGYQQLEDHFASLQNSTMESRG
ncbi:MAG: DUF3109 family protein [Ignavibacteriae bacterium]|nr:DUF3109 family protein [Ignavibacteriota bacterium]